MRMAVRGKRSLVHYSPAPRVRFKYATLRSLVVVPDRENARGDERFKHRDYIVTMIEYDADT